MQISFHGAAREVTGSCHLVDTGKTRFLVDCGMFQGGRFAEKKNYDNFGFNPAELDFVILTHAHLDHCGRLPKLCLERFTGPIYCTAPTRDFAEIVLRDSARLILSEAKADGHAPLYRASDVDLMVASCKTFDYHQLQQVAPDVAIRFYDAGHILGSAFVEVLLGAGLNQQRLVFSGDLGNPPVPLLRETEFISGADVVVMESTYGGRIHEPAPMRRQMLQEVFSRTINAGGVLMIPAFAIERTQELLYELNQLVESRAVPPADIYLDSPMAIAATEVCKKYPELYNDESKALIKSGDDLFNFPNLHFTAGKLSSKQIDKNNRAKVIIAGSGMANGGRILFHLKRYLSQAKNQVLIVGYQAEGTLGRALLDGAEFVRIEGSSVAVKAQVTAIGAYSAHADQPKLLHWIKMMTAPKPKKVFLVHGEAKAAEMVADGLTQKLNVSSVIPEYGQAYQL